MPTGVDAVLDWLKREEKSSIGRLMDWLRIKSISTDPAFAPEVRKAAEWAAARLREGGMTAEVCEASTPSGGKGHPLVMAHSPGAGDYKGPHVLFYGHYDVQPVDPVELWESPPFDPVLKPAVKGGPGERIVARGAVDDKGQVMMFLESLRAWKDAGGAVAGGVKLTVLLEGEEESGSVSLEKFIKDNKATRLAGCDVCVISDTGMLARGKPAITYGVRGISYTEVTLHGPDQDLHSGLWGGRAPNPNNELVKVLGQLWDKDRRVTIPGFYDDVRPLQQSERDEWKRLGFDPVEALKKIGYGKEADVGEAGYSAMEREWARPTAEINGLWGGYTGAGAKTVIPSKASAKVSFRLVADQSPDRVRDSFFQWLRDRTPPGCRWELTDLHGGPPATVKTDSPPLAAAVRAIERATGVKPAMIKSGGSIPVAGLLNSILGIETIFMGFGLDDDRVHSPNEKFEVDCFRMGARSHAVLLDELAKTG